MAKMASEQAEATRVPTLTELSKELEAIIKEQHPNYDQANIYAAAYGILLANTTKEKLSQIIEVWKAN